MSNFQAGYTCGGCCEPVNSSLPPNPCTSPTACRSLFDAIVQAILNSGTRVGITAEEIYESVSTLCPEFGATEVDIDEAITMMARRGIIKRSSSGGNFVFLVMAAMANLNPPNVRYNRPTCQLWMSRATRGRAVTPQECQFFQNCTTTLDGQIPESLTLRSGCES
jgi:hypothetical protein